MSQDPKTPRRARRRRTTPTRRWCLPPGLLREPDEYLEASQILEEFRQDSDLAYLLWSALRDVTLWAGIDPDRRPGLFGPAGISKRLEAISTAGLDPELEVSLTSLTAVVDAPARTSSEVVSLACVEVSRWAVARGAMGTAMAFAQAASLAAPDSAAPAVFAGEVALRWVRLGRAETWLRRGIGLGRRAREWDAYTRAYVHLGKIYSLRGSTAAARRYYITAMRAGRRHGLRALRATAFHGLLRMALDAGDWENAERYLRAAVRGFDRGDPRLADVLHDGAYLWVSVGRYSRALTLLSKLLVIRTEPRDRALALALQARAAAGAGERRLYQEAWSSAWSMIDRATTPAEHARALLELGRASSHVRDWPRVAQVARLQSTFPAPAHPADRRIAEQLAALAAEARRPSEDSSHNETRPEEAPTSEAPHRGDEASGRRNGRGWPEYSHAG